MSIRSKIICALFICAFVIYSFNVSGYDFSRYIPSGETVRSYLDPREWSWQQRAAILASMLGIAAAYKYLYEPYQRHPYPVETNRPQLPEKELLFRRTLEHIQAKQTPWEILDIQGDIPRDQIKEKYKAMAGSIDPSHTTKEHLQEEARVALAKLNRARDALLSRNLDYDAIKKIIAIQITKSDVGDRGINMRYQELTKGDMLSDQENDKIIEEIKEKRKKMQEDIQQHVKRLSRLPSTILDSFIRQLPKSGLITALKDIVFQIEAYMKAQKQPDEALGQYINILNKWTQHLENNGYQPETKQKTFEALGRVDNQAKEPLQL